VVHDGEGKALSAATAFCSEPKVYFSSRSLYTAITRSSTVGRVTISMTRSARA